MEHNKWMTGSNRVDYLLNNLEIRKTLPLKRRSRAFWLLVLYILLVTIPWILTCILAQRPVSAASYINHKGFADSEIRSFRYWKNAVEVLNSIAGLITIPFLSALLTQAAVVFCQRTRPGQFLGLQDLFALADRGWTNPAAIWRSIRSPPVKSSPGVKWSGSFLIPAACLILLGALQQPLYQILVHMEETAVSTCSDTLYQYRMRDPPHCANHTSSAYKPIGIEIEPAQMAHIYHTRLLPRLSSDLASISLDEEQPSLWSDKMPKRAWDSTRSRLSQTPAQTYKSLRYWLPSFASGLRYEPYELPKFFAAGLSTNSTTGVLRQHVMRFNSSVQCNQIDRRSFPSPCPGKGPFTATLQKSKDTDIRVCVPGEVGIFPWTNSRDRQDLTEELYLDLWDGELGVGDLQSNRIPVNATIRCEVKTTRGYFELGNMFNNDTNGPLLTQWPSRDHMAENTNDWVDKSLYEGFIPSEMDDYAGEKLYEPSTLGGISSRSWRVSSPLTMSAIALFGNTSWLHNTVAYATNMTYKGTNTNDSSISWQQLCSGMPFGNLGASDLESRPASVCSSIQQSFLVGYEARPDSLLRLIHAWIAEFVPKRGENDFKMAESLLQISLFTVNRALLTYYSPNVNPSGDSTYGWAGRTIYSSPGQMVQRPILDKATTIALSLLLALQLIGLAYLAYYIYHVPTWTGALDAMAIAQIGASLAHQDVLPPMGPVTAKDIDALRNVDGLVGLVRSQDEASRTRRLASSHTSEDGASDIELQRVEMKGAYMNVEAQGPPLQFGLGASGIIHSGSGGIGLARHRKDEDGGDA